MPANYPGSAPGIPTGTSTTPVNTTNWNTIVDETNAIGQDLVDVKPGDETPFDHSAAATSNLKNALIAMRNVLSDLAKRVTGASNWYNNPLDETLLRNQIGQRIPVRNDTGATINIGDLVYISGQDASSRLQITKAIASAETTLAVGIVVDANIATATNGYVSLFSILTAQNTSGQVVGNAVYLSSATAGGYTFTAPSTAQTIGRVVKVDAAAGIIAFDINPRKDGGAAAADPTFNSIKVYPSTDIDAAVFKAANAATTNELSEWQNNLARTTLRAKLNQRTVAGATKDIIDFEHLPVLDADDANRNIISSYLKFKSSTKLPSSAAVLKDFSLVFATNNTADGHDKGTLYFQDMSDKAKIRFVVDNSTSGVSKISQFLQSGGANVSLGFQNHTDNTLASLKNNRYFDFELQDATDEFRLVVRDGADALIASSFTVNNTGIFRILNQLLSDAPSSGSELTVAAFRNSAQVSTLGAIQRNRTVAGASRDIIDLEVQNIIAATAADKNIVSAYITWIANAFRTTSNISRSVRSRAFTNNANDTDDFYGVSFRDNNDVSRVVFSLSDSSAVDKKTVVEARSINTDVHYRLLIYGEAAQTTLFNDRFFELTHRYTTPQEFRLRVVNLAGAVISVPLIAETNGNVTLSNRMRNTKGADITAASTLTLGNDGNMYTIVGTTTINHITTTGWTSGSFVIFLFNGTVTVTYNAATPPANTAAIILSGAVNFGATGSDMLMLVYDGSFWREVARTVV